MTSYLAPLEDDPFISPSEIITPVLAQAANAQAFATQIQIDALATIEAMKDSAVDSFLNLDDLFGDDLEALFDIDESRLDGIELVSPKAVTISNIFIAEAEKDFPVIVDLDLSDLENINDEFPAYSVIKPVIDIMDMPDDEFPTFTEEAPGTSELIIPSKPFERSDLPPIPKITDKVIPAPPEYTEYVFEGIRPTDNLKPPTSMFVYNEAEYNSEVANQLTEKILSELSAGSTGLTEDVENAIWDRARERQVQENEEAYQRELTFFSSRGFSLPPGQLNAKLRGIQARIDQKNQDLNNDILVQSSELAQKNAQFIITSAIQLEKNLMDNSNQVANRAFEKAKATLQFIHDQFDLALKHLAMKWDGYKVLAQVYETKIRAEIAKAEWYEKLIAGIEAGTRAEALAIQAYESIVKGLETLVTMYATEMEAAKIQSEIDVNNLRGYQIKADVFTKKVDAVTAKYQARQTQIAGESEKINMYKTENEAYAIQTEAVKNIADIALSKAEIKLKGHQGYLEHLRTMLEKYKIESDVNMAKAETELKLSGLDVDIFKAEIAKYQADIDAIIKNYLGKVDAAKAESEIIISERQIALQKLLGEKGLISEQMIATSELGGKIAAAALTSISASTNIGMSQSRTESENRTRSDTESNSTSHIYTHNE